MESPPAAKRRTLVTWLMSLVAGAVFLWLASLRLQLWPDPWFVVNPWFLGAAAALHVPYAVLRAMRLQYVFDPLVVRASEGRERGFDRRVLYGSGFVSFLVLLVLPLKLGELSRPLLLSRGNSTGVGVAESLSGVAMERLVDGLLICAMLFGGLALAHPRTDVDLGHVRQIGGGLLVLFAMGLGALLWTARDPVLWGQRVGRLFARVWFGPHAVQVVRRFSGAMQGVLSHALPFLTWSVTYWAITVLQSWLVLRAAGVEVGAAEAATIVAIIGLSIQLPGGPAQAGVFQVGASVALALFLDETALAGPGSTFVALMYVLQLLGAVVMAVPGAALLWRRTRGKA